MLSGFILFLTGCESKIQKPDPLLDEDTYASILVEMMIIRTQQAANPDSVNVDSLRNLVFSYYEVPEQQFMESHKYYEQFVREHEARVNRIIDSLQAELERIENQPVFSDTTSAYSEETE